MTSKGMKGFYLKEEGRLEQLVTVCSIEVRAKTRNDSRFRNHKNNLVDC